MTKARRLLELLSPSVGMRDVIMRDVIMRCMIMLCAGFLCSGCFGVKAIGSGPLLERPTYSIKVDPNREGNELTVAATITNTSPTRRLDLRQARITHLSRYAVEITPIEVVGPCLSTVLEAHDACSFWTRYDVTGGNPFPSKWEVVLDGEVVQFTLDD